MQYITVLNNNLEYSLGDNHTVNLSFESTTMCVEYSLGDNHTVNLSFESTTMCVFHATESINAVLAKT